MQSHNPLPQDPIRFDATAASLLEDAQFLISRTKNVWDHIVTSVKPESVTWSNTIAPIIQDENLKSTTVRVLQFYASTSPIKALRDASSSVATMFNDFEVELYARSDMFILVDAAIQSLLDDLDYEARHYLKKLHRKFFQNGCGVTNPSMKAHFEKCQKRLKEIQRECNRNMHEEKTGIWLTLDELEGVPKTFVHRLKRNVDDGQYWVATKVPQSGPVMEYAKSESTRKKLFYAIQNRMPANIPLFRELVLLRDETARLLGYRNHASFKIADKMLETPRTVERLLSEIQTRLVPRGRDFAKELLKLKEQDAAAQGEVADKIFFWDQAYYKRVQIEMETPHTVDVTEYFELHTTLRKLLQMFERLFGTRFENVEREQQRELGRDRPLIWHEDVLMYTVWQNGTNNSFIGYAYFDLHPREGKYTHAGHYSLQPTWVKADGTRFHPSSVLVMNYSKFSDRPTLLDLNGVRKLFHEIGHLIHALSTETNYAASHYVDRDFVEAPSLMLEQFFWQACHIKEVSFHYSHISSSYKEIWRKSLLEGQANAREDEIDEKLPDDVVAALAQRNLDRKSVFDQLHELFFATYDMRIHSPSSHEELESWNLTELFNKMKSEIHSLNGGEAVGDGWKWGHGETVFRNVINNYDAGYYSYILGRVFALDIFKTGFEADFMSKEAGKRYRDMVLRFGGSQPELKTLTDYLGRQPSTRPYFEYLGIAMGDHEFALKPHPIFSCHPRTKISRNSKHPINNLKSSQPQHHHKPPTLHLPYLQNEDRRLPPSPREYHAGIRKRPVFLWRQCASASTSSIEYPRRLTSRPLSTRTQQRYSEAGIREVDTKSPSTRQELNYRSRRYFQPRRRRRSLRKPPSEVRTHPPRKHPSRSLRTSWQCRYVMPDQRRPKDRHKRRSYTRSSPARKIHSRCRCL